PRPPLRELDGLHPEHRVVGRDAPQLLVRRIGADAPEEHADLELPPPEVVAEDRHLFGVGDLDRLEGLHAAAHDQLPSARDADVPHPLRLAARRDEVLRAVAGQQVHGRAAPLARLAPSHAQHPRAPHADAEPREHRDDPVEHVLREPVGPLVMRHPNYDSHELTYSIVARDKDTGELGVAVQSHYFHVGPVVPWALAGVGAVATQSHVNISFGPLGLEFLKDGYTAQQALNALLAGDDKPDMRQLAIVDAAGNVATHTGPKCIPAAGHRTGDGFSCQANLMENDTVWGAMFDAYTSAQGPLAERMLAALDAAEAEGGDIRGRQSAAMLVVRGNPSGRSWEDRTIDLRVDDSRDPLLELRRLLRIKRAYASDDAAERLEVAGDVKAAAR